MNELEPEINVTLQYTGHSFLKVRHIFGSGLSQTKTILAGKHTETGDEK